MSILMVKGCHKMTLLFSLFKTFVCPSKVYGEEMSDYNA